GLVRLGAPEDVLDETLLADIYGCDVRVESNSATSRPTVWVPYTTDASPRRAERQMRICSLLPSATEIVLALGLGDHLVALTHECDRPAGARPVPVITRSTVDHGTRGSREIHTHVTAAAHMGSSLYALDQELLEQLDPDIIPTQELCDVCAVSYDQVAEAVHRLDATLPGQRTVLSLEPKGLAGILGV